MHKLAITLVILTTGFAVFAQENLQDALNHGSRPSSQHFYIDIDDEQNNHIALPIAVIHGKKAGPVFTIISGVHGFEYPPIIASQELIQDINPELLVGSLIIVPIANPSSFYGRSPFVNPQDQVNLNRAFPGSSTGSITQKIAHFISKDIIPPSDVFLDIHGGDANEDLLPFVCYYQNEQAPSQTQTAQKLCESSGFSYVVAYPYTLKKSQKAKYAFKQAVQEGKTALSIECGKLGNVQKEAVAMIKQGIYNMLHTMNMYPKQASTQTDFITLNQQAYIRAKQKGVFFSDYTAGDPVSKGDIVGVTKNEFGKVVAEIKAPVSGTILYKIGTPPVNEGETIMCIAYQL